MAGTKRKLGQEGTCLRQPESDQSEPGVASRIVAIADILALVLGHIQLIDIIDIIESGCTSCVVIIAFLLRQCVLSLDNPAASLLYVRCDLCLHHLLDRSHRSLCTKSE